MKDGWETCDLGDVLERTETIDPTRDPDKEFHYIDVSSVNNKTLSIETVSKLKGSEAPSRARKLVRTNDAIFATVRPTLKRIALIPEQYDKQVCSTGYFVLRGKEFIDNRFLFYFLQSDEVFATVEKLQKGASYPAITDSDVKGLRFSYPPIEEQRRIVAILDETFACIDRAKANTKKNIQNARELFDSYLNNIFSNPGPDWETKTLKEVCAKITDGTHQTPTYFDHGYVFLSSRNVTSGKIDWDNVKYIDERQHLEMHKRVAPRVGDILLAKNGTTGVAALVDRDIVFDIYVSLAHIRVLDEVSPQLMLSFINSGSAKKQFNKRLKGSGVPNLHLEEIREVVISYPKSKQEQKEIVERLGLFMSHAKDIEKASQKKLYDLNEMRGSILQKAFSGSL